MSDIPCPDDEEARLEELADYRILDTPPEEAFERIADMAMRIFDIPIATVTLVDRDRQWFKACRGFGVRETPRRDAFCAHTILNDGVMVVPDATRDERFEDSPLVTGEPGIRFYAGAPLVTPDDYRIGDVCIMDLEPRFHLPDDSRQTLADLADIAIDELEKRRFERQRDQLERTSETLDALVPDPVIVETPDHDIAYLGDALASRLGYAPDELQGQSADVLSPDASPPLSEQQSTPRLETPLTCKLRRRDGTLFEAKGRRQVVRRDDETPIGYVTIWSQIESTTPG